VRPAQMKHPSGVLGQLAEHVAETRPAAPWAAKMMHPALYSERPVAKGSHSVTACKPSAPGKFCTHSFHGTTDSREG